MGAILGKPQDGEASYATGFCNVGDERSGVFALGYGRLFLLVERSAPALPGDERLSGAPRGFHARSAHPSLRTIEALVQRLLLHDVLLRLLGCLYRQRSLSLLHLPGDLPRGSCAV